MRRPENMTLQATVQGEQRDRSRAKSSSSGNHNQDDTTSTLADKFSWPGRIAVLLALLLSPWAIASVHHWAHRYILLALLVGLGFWWFETAVSKKSKQVFPYLFFPVFIGLLIGLFQVMPLPDWLTAFFLERQSELFSLYFEGTEYPRTISMDREETWHQIRLLLMAVSSLLLGCRYFKTKRDIVLLMTLMVVNGFALSVLGIIHELTAEYGKVYWVFDISVRTSCFGPFINPNNAAGYLLMCLGCGLGLLPIVMPESERSGPRTIVSKEIPYWRQLFMYLLEFIADLNAKKVALLIALSFIAIGVLATLSKGGVVAFCVGGIATLFIFGVSRKPSNSGLILIPVVGLVIALGAWLGLGDKVAKDFGRIDMVDLNNSDVRIKLWQDTLPASNDFGLFGSGLGSHKGVHRLYRSESHEDVLFVYAENQYVQSLIEAGWPGLILLLIAFFLLYKSAALLLKEGKSPTTVGVGVTGIFVVITQAAASVFDFGFYIGANMVGLAVLAGFVSYHAQAFAGRLKKRNWLDFKVSNLKIQVLVLVLVAGGTIAALDAHRRAGLEALMKPRSKFFDYTNVSLEETDRRIEEMTQRIETCPSVSAANYLGELWIHRGRLNLMSQFLRLNIVPEVQDTDTPEQKKAKQQEIDRINKTSWDTTHLQRLHENVCYLRSYGSKYDLAEFRNQPSIKENYQNALAYFRYSSQQSPLQPVVFLRLSLLKGLLGEAGSGYADMERALSLAPMNSSFRQLAATYYLQEGNVDAAAPLFRRVLELRPSSFGVIATLISGRASTFSARPTDRQVNDLILPDNPKMLFDYATNYLDPASEERSKMLDRAEALLQNQEFAVVYNLVLAGKICEQNGKFEQAIDHYGAALRSYPADEGTRKSRTELLEKVGRLDEALKEAENLVRQDKDKAVYTRIRDRIAKKVRDRDRSPN